MFQNVLIAEDQNTINKGVERTLNELNIPNIITTQYCDDALLKIKGALNTNNPFNLLITDLSFKADHRERKLTSGDALIEAVKNIQPNLKIIVFASKSISLILKSINFSFKILDTFSSCINLNLILSNDSLTRFD